MGQSVTMNTKLVIWDLDNTLWDGVLDECEVFPNRERIKIIGELNDRGVINSVCSKNDPDRAKAKLAEMSLLDEIIFPSISWQPKGLMVKSIIEACQLRSEDVLFVDDEEANLGEAAFYNPKINTLNALNDHANAVLKSIVSANVTDDRKRFRQYRNLEKKNIVRMEYSDNKIFLRESGIEIWLDHRCELYLERIEELVNRTNQSEFYQEPFEC